MQCVQCVQCALSRIDNRQCIDNAWPGPCSGVAWVGGGAGVSVAGPWPAVPLRFRCWRVYRAAAVVELVCGCCGAVDGCVGVVAFG